MKLDPEIRSVIESALKEDHVHEDLTSKLLVGAGAQGTARIISKERGILCGAEIARKIFLRMDPRCKVRLHARDGKKISPGSKIMTVHGRWFKILASERTALNFLQHLSGVATLTARFVAAVRGTGARIYDTRKTVPGIRHLQKYAVRCGGGINHRMDLSAMVMVKDNHLRVVGSPWGPVNHLKKKLPSGTLLEVEAKNLGEVRLALRSKADIIMLDNMDIHRAKMAIKFIRRAVQDIDSRYKPRIEVSGGIRLKNVRRIAQLGVDRISVGALTHSAPALDISLNV